MGDGGWARLTTVGSATKVVVGYPVIRGRAGSRGRRGEVSGAARRGEATGAVDHRWWKREGEGGGRGVREAEECMMRGGRRVMR